MNISYNWLKTWIEIPDKTPAEIGEFLTSTGLEVEKMHIRSSVEIAEKVVVGEVISCVEHTNSDKLKVTKVDTGTEVLQIVCGAPNVASGQNVVVALVGAQLTPVGAEESFKIKKSKLRGEVSQGMICALEEIGIDQPHEGIYVLPEHAVKGSDPAEYLDPERDILFEIGLTPNRADAMSHQGVARDLRAYCMVHDIPFTWMENPLEEIAYGNKELKIAVDSPDCLRYTAVEISGVDGTLESPEWLKKRLRSIDISPLNALVDITNWVQHDIGQPLHCFDMDSLQEAKVHVRKAKEGEKITTLDSVERILTAEDLVIADATTAHAIAGVFGGNNGGVSSSTHTILIESAAFHPVSIRKAAKRHGLHTDASFRYERGVDPYLTLEGIARAVSIVRDVFPEAKIVSKLYDYWPEPSSFHSVEYSPQKVNTFLGLSLPNTMHKRILEALEMKVSEEKEDLWTVNVPNYRVDVLRWTDLSEEVARIYGFDRIPVSRQFSFALDQVQKSSMEDRLEDVSSALVENGWQQVMHNSLQSEKFGSYVSEDVTPVFLKNPLSSELNMLRTSLIPEIAKTWARNSNSGEASIRCFEYGNVYELRDGKPSQKMMLGLCIAGESHTNSWLKREPLDSRWLLHAEIDELLREQGILGVQKSNGTADYLENVVQWKRGKTVMASMGTLNAKFREAFDIPSTMWFASVEWETISKGSGRKTPKFSTISRFPKIHRDLALLVPTEHTFQDIRNTAFRTDKHLLQSVEIFDVYSGKGVPEGKVSYALHFVFQSSEKTLTDSDVHSAIWKIYTQLQKRHSVELRDGELIAP